MHCILLPAPLRPPHYTHSHPVNTTDHCYPHIYAPIPIHPLNEYLVQQDLCKCVVAKHNEVVERLTNFGVGKGTTHA